MDLDKFKEFECSGQNVRSAIVLSTTDNGSKNIMEWLSINEGYSRKTSLFDDSVFELHEIHDDVNTFSAITEYEENRYLLNFIQFPDFWQWPDKNKMHSADACLMVIGASDEDVVRLNTLSLKKLVKNRIKPIIFLDRLDLLVKMYGDDVEGIVGRIARIMNSFNEIIEKELGSDEWNLEIAKGNIIFGSTVYGWAFNRRVLDKARMQFKDIAKAVKDYCQEELCDSLPVTQAIYDGIIKNCPPASQSLSYRLPAKCEKDIGDEMAQSIVEGDCDGPLVVMFLASRYNKILKVRNIFCRVMSGTLRKGDRIRLMGSDEIVNVKETFIFGGPLQLYADEIPAGKMGSVQTDKNVWLGEFYVL